MSTWMRSARRGGCVLLCLLGGVVAVLAAGAPEPAGVQITILDATPDKITLKYDLADFAKQTVPIEDKLYAQLSVPGESLLMVANAPEVPVVCRSVIIPDDAEMQATVLDTKIEEYTDVGVAPSKGILLRTVDPNKVPFKFGSVYGVDAFYPDTTVSLGTPYILRDHRGLTIQANLFQYNPVARLLRVYRSLTVQVTAVGPGKFNVLDRNQAPKLLDYTFQQLYSHHFLNYVPPPKLRFDENGSLLIIGPDAWATHVQPLVDHKIARGIDTSYVSIESIGNTETDIKHYIRLHFHGGTLAFVLLVGDNAQVTTARFNGAASDPSYGLLFGNDNYPDVLIGRLSAENLGQLDTQVLRTIEYETSTTTPTWAWRAVGIGSAQGAGIGDHGEADWVHMDVIRDLLLNHGYNLVDRIYDPGATAAQVAAAVNSGRGLINYCGHGSMTSWVTTGFSNADVGALFNDNMLPVIVSVACVNGQFDAGTCFAEAWLRATHGTEPSGAVGMYASSVNQSWAPPMAAQDAANELLTHEDFFSFGALCFGGSCTMMDRYGDDGAYMFKTWHVFGDPSLRVYGPPRNGLVVRPTRDFHSAGPRGGPFNPVQREYILENRSNAPIAYALDYDALWLDANPPSGVIPAYGATSVWLSIAPLANCMDPGHYEELVQFINGTTHIGDTFRTVTLDIVQPTGRLSWNMNTDPGWQTEGLWAWGVPTGGGGAHGGPDPTAGHTGAYVYGYNLNGDYANNCPVYNLTTGPIACTGLRGVQLRFWRWLGVEGPGDQASVQVSTDGINWNTVWQNTGEIADLNWVYQQIDIAALASRQPHVYLRWTMGPTDWGVQCCGWNIDDVEIWGFVTPEYEYEELD